MTVRPRTAWRFACGGVVLAGLGCATQSPLPPGAFVRGPVEVPQIPAPAPPPHLPEPPAADPKPGAALRPGSAQDAPLALREVLSSVEAAFPLLYAVEQERQITAGQRLSAEGQFDPVVRSRGVDQTGSFANGVLDTVVEQATPFGGASAFAGWRLGIGNFPVYYGERKTGEGGEYRTGVVVPLLQNRDIDVRRARLLAAQITEKAADPIVRRARLDYFRAAAQAYWVWQAAGAQYLVTQDLVRLARERQALLDERRKQGLVGESVPVLNQRLIAGREEARLGAERQLQQAAVRLSLYLRDSAGNPVVPSSEWLLPTFGDATPPRPDIGQLEADVAAALVQRPELVRFQLEKERRAVELKLATNQLAPVLNAYAQVAQDVGAGKKTLTGTGSFAFDRTTSEVGATFEMPLPFRNARGLSLTARAQLAQLLAQERYARDEITSQVQDAVSELVQTYLRIEKAREELRLAVRVLELDTESFRARQTSLVDLNLQEIAAAEARAKVVNVLGAYQAAVANYRAVIGIEAAAGGAVLPRTEPEPVPPVKPMPPPVEPKP
ncbi:TolC family protein [Gemmata sp.]|uniref:TolC family protein n=1 Tax=Gemmata sp. TaxID=1914242 RepID=UPI003F72BA5A